MFAELAEWVESNDVFGPQRHRYGDDPEQVADLRMPTGDGPHPVMVLIHGGNWRAQFSKTTIEALAVGLTQAGWATWNIEYRRVGNGGGVPATGADVAAAIRALQDVPGIDLQRLILLGHSSGGQLALRAAQKAQVAAVVCIAGYCDLREATRLGLGNNAVPAFCGGGPDEVPENFDAANPTRHLPLGKKTLLAHGTADEVVPPSLSASYAANGQRVGDSCELLLLQDAGHFDVIDPRSEHWRTIEAATARLLEPEPTEHSPGEEA
ncbi:alpha/beta hydrolase family protein [Streptomyces sp. NPDC059455]|uniref:alpha/beta hydrolase family protein n=1 Tax=Streptomyces sp. NPDC059455 TaxID=3346837 RepID=UPI0036816836